MWHGVDAPANSETVQLSWVCVCVIVCYFNGFKRIFLIHLLKEPLRVSQQDDKTEP